VDAAQPPRALAPTYRRSAREHTVSEPSYETEISIEPGYLKVVLRGRYEAQNTMAFIATLAREMDARRTERALIDARGTSGTAQRWERYDQAKAVFEHLGARRVAIVRGGVSADQYVESVVAKLGGQLKAFASIDEAMDWLLADGRKDPAQAVDAYAITTISEPGYLRITAAGKTTVARVNHLIDFIESEARRHGGARVLVDITGFEGKLEQWQRYELAKVMVGRFDRLIVAVLGSEPTLNFYTFDTAAKLGTNIRAFLVEVEAIAWLLEPLPNPHAIAFDEYAVDIRKDEGFLRITAKGEVDAARSRRLIATTVTEAAAHGETRVLLDCRPLAGAASEEADRVVTASFAGRAFRTPLRVAMIDRPERMNRYIEIVALNRGGNAGMFSEEGEAREWLLGA
jgi:hypothetical protein